MSQDRGFEIGTRNNPFKGRDGSDYYTITSLRVADKAYQAVMLPKIGDPRHNPVDPDLKKFRDERNPIYPDGILANPAKRVEPLMLQTERKAFVREVNSPTHRIPTPEEKGARPYWRHEAIRPGLSVYLLREPRTKDEALQDLERKQAAYEKMQLREVLSGWDFMGMAQIKAENDNLTALIPTLPDTYDAPEDGEGSLATNIANTPN